VWGTKLAFFGGTFRGPPRTEQPCGNMTWKSLFRGTLEGTGGEGISRPFEKGEARDCQGGPVLSKKGSIIVAKQRVKEGGPRPEKLF